MRTPTSWNLPSGSAPGSLKAAGTEGAIPLSMGLLMLVSPLISCKSGVENIYHESKIVMGTIVEISVAHRSEAAARAAIREAMGEFQRLDDLLSSYEPGSVVSKLNASGAATKVPVGGEVYRLVRDAVAICGASEGAFDPTIWPISRLWDFNRGEKVPTAAEIADKLKYVGCEMLEFDDINHSVGFRRDGMGLDLGAVAKGWAVDRAMERLIDLGIRDAIIDAGGDLRIIGTRPGKDSWRIGVQHPRDAGALIFRFALRDTAIATSGDYQRFFTIDGVRYHHILDPATGKPARGCQSVTVFAPTAAEADACATAAFVLGPSAGLAFLRGRPALQGFIVGADGQVHWTDEAIAAKALR